MKPRHNRDLIIFIILIPLFLWSAFYIGSISEGKLPPYTVNNKAASGYSIFFQTLRELNYPVERTLKTVDKCSNKSFQLVAQASGFDINDNSIKKWVKSGGKLLFLSPKDYYFVDYGEKVKVEGNILVYKYGSGVIIAADISDLTNRALAGKTDRAYEILKAMDSYEYDKIFFNEAYIYSADQNTLWNFIPIKVKYLIYQLLLVLAAYFYFRGKRFGKPLPLYEEVERVENEYLYSAASLYRQAKCWDLMVDSYYKDFLRRMRSSPEDWLEYWKNEDLPHQDIAMLVYNFMNNNHAKLRAKEYEKIVIYIDRLKSTIEKRSGHHWKTLKKTM